MDPTVIRFPMASGEPLEHDLAEIDAAIALIASGVATRVRLVGLKRPDGVAAIGLAHAQQASVTFALDHDPLGATTVMLGPRRT